MIKTQHLILLLLSFVIILPFPCDAQKLAQNYNLRQKSAFRENKGQVTDQNGNLRKDVKYIYSALGLNVTLMSNSISYEVIKIEKKTQKNVFSEATGLAPTTTHPNRFHEPEVVTVHTHRIDVSFIGANPNPEIIAEERSSYYNNYYLAHTPEEGMTNVYSYSKLTYKNLYPNIDIIFYAREEGKLKYDIVVHPGGKLENVKMKYIGMDELILAEGKIKVKTSLYDLTEEIPFSYIQESKKNEQVGYSINKDEVGFISFHDKNKTLIIDPLVIWGTYYGEDGSDYGNDITSDGNGNVYIIGTTSSSYGFASIGAHQTVNQGGRDVFLAKFNKNGIRIWGTYYGGQGVEFGNAICLDNNNNIYITGESGSISGIVSTGAHQVNRGGSTDAFITKFNNNGVRQWGTFYGGSDPDIGKGICTDNNGNIYVSGSTTSKTGIATSGAHLAAYSGTSVGFIVKFNKDGKRKWGTYYEGSCNSITSGTTGFIYFVGQTMNTTGVSTQGAFQGTFGGGNNDAFLAKFDTSGVRSWGTYYGGDGNDRGYGICLDRKGNIYIAGSTTSLSGISSSGTYQTTFGGGYSDAFVVKFSNIGIRQWATYFGGNGEEMVTDIFSVGSDKIYLAGGTFSTTGIATQSTHQFFNGGNEDGYFAIFNSSAKRVWASYYGGTSTDRINGIVADDSGKVFIIGYTSSIGSIATKNVFQNTYNGGGNDVFFARFKDTICHVEVSLNGNRDVCIGSTNSYTAIKNVGFIYNWQIKGGTISSGQGTDSINVSWDSSKAGSIKLVTSTSLLCRDSILINIIKHEQPKAITGGNKTICPGDHIRLGDSLIKGNLYFWKDNHSGFSDTIANPVVSPTITTVYYLTETVKETGCSKIDSVTITVGALPLAGFTTAATCLGNATFFIDSSKSALNYIWSFGDGDSATIVNPKHTYKSAGKYQVTLIVISSNGCTDTVTNVIDVDPLPVAGFSFSKTCLGENTEFTGTITGAATYLWNFGDGNTSTLANPTHKYAGTGAFNVKMKVWNGAGCTDSITRSVVIDPLPLASISVTKDSAQRTYTFSTTSNAAAYLWSFGDGIADTGKIVKHTYQKDSTYTVKIAVRDTNGCNSIADTTLTVFTVGITKIQSPVFEIKLYPNPFSNSTNLEYQLKERTNIEISIYDLSGKEIAIIQNGIQTEGKYNYVINTDKYQLKAGIYILKILAGNQILSRQLIKLKE